MNNNVSRIVNILGIIKSVGEYVPMDPIYPECRNNDMVEDSGVTMMVIERFYKEMVGSFDFEDIIKNMVYVNDNIVPTVNSDYDNYN